MQAYRGSLQCGVLDKELSHVGEHGTSRQQLWRKAVHPARHALRLRIVLPGVPEHTAQVGEVTLEGKVVLPRAQQHVVELVARQVLRKPSREALT